MSLVAYDSSDESEEEKKPTKKQKKESVKIKIPSLREFEDEEEVPIAKKPKLQSGSGLFNLLPPPKNTAPGIKSGLVPHILTSRKEKSLSSPIQNKKNSTVSSTSFKVTSTTSTLTTSEEHESDDEDVSATDSSNASGRCDFFWLDDLASKNETKVSSSVNDDTFLKKLSSQLPCSSSSNIPQTYLNETEDVSHMQQYQKPSMTNEVENNVDHVSSEHQSQLIGNDFVMNSSSNSTDILSNQKEFVKLTGRKREFENIDIIDVNADDQLTDRNNWLMKSMTEETTYRSKKKHGLPTQQQKRKHQITYLAFQAKEREMDLKNQWALNRLTRRETQSKYGF